MLPERETVKPIDGISHGSDADLRVDHRRLDVGVTQWFTDGNAVKNSNPYWVYELTVRTPNEDTPDVSFYFVQRSEVEEEKPKLPG